MIEIQSLDGGYPGNPVLHGIDAWIPGGKITVIVGPNGCGKSTLLKTLAGILPRSGGDIRIGGQDIGSFSPRELAQQVAFLPQSRQSADLTALRMVLHGRFPYLSYPRRYSPRDLQIARQAMDRLGIGGLEAASVSTLSGGTRQKVYIAMALAQDTPIVLMDEPTTFLDVAHQLQMMRDARFLADSGKTVVMVLHDLTMALGTADLVAVMAGGRLLRQGSPQEVFASGCLDGVFGVRVNRFQTPSGWQYYYESL